MGLEEVWVFKSGWLSSSLTVGGVLAIARNLSPTLKGAEKQNAFLVTQIKLWGLHMAELSTISCEVGETRGLIL